MLFDFGSPTFRASENDVPVSTVISEPVENEESYSSGCWNLLTFVLMVIVGVMLYFVLVRPSTVSLSNNCSGMKVKTNTDLEHIQSDSHFEKICNEHPVVIVMFHAPWCGHCKQLKPHFEEAAKKSDKKFVMVSDDQRKLMKEHDIKGFPTIKKVKGKNTLKEFAGPRTVQGLLDFAK